MNNIPQHPGAQQGLGAPQGAPQQQGNQNPYYKPNVALEQANGGLTGATQQREAQIAQASAEAGKAKAEANIMAGLGALGQQAQRPDVLPQEVQAGQLTDGIIKGQLGQEQLAAMVQAGEVSPEVADAAVMQAQQFLQEDQARLQQSGLGGSF